MRFFEPLERFPGKLSESTQNRSNLGFSLVKSSWNWANTWKTDIFDTVWSRSFWLLSTMAVTVFKLGLQIMQNSLKTLKMTKNAQKCDFFEGYSRNRPDCHFLLEKWPKIDQKWSKMTKIYRFFDEKMPKLAIFEISDFGQFEVFWFLPFRLEILAKNTFWVLFGYLPQSNVVQNLTHICTKYMIFTTFGTFCQFVSHGGMPWKLICTLLCTRAFQKTAKNIKKWHLKFPEM